MDNKYTIKADMMFFKSFENQPYPAAIHKLNLDMEVDYIIGLGQQFQKRNKDLSCKLYNIDKDVVTKINKYISENKNSDGQDMLIFYLMMKTAIQILYRNYDEDGVRRY